MSERLWRVVGAVSVSAALAMSTGCIFFDDEPTSTPSPAIDMGSSQDMTSSMDMTRPDADQGVADQGVADQAPEVSCEEVACPSGLACVSGECVDLLTSPDHCGAIGNACNALAGSSCANGLCTCGEQQASQRGLALQIAAQQEGYRPWPEALLLGAPTAARFACEAGVALEECPEGKLVFNEEYPVEKAHYVAIYSRAGRDDAAGDAFALQPLDGRGERVGEALVYEGSDMLERKLLAMRVVDLSDQALLVALWEGTISGQKTRVILIYQITIDDMSGKVTIARIANEKGDPLVLGRDERIVDTDIVLGQIELMGRAPVGIVATPYVTLKSDNLFTDSQVHSGGMLIDGSGMRAMKHTLLGDIKGNFHYFQGFGGVIGKGPGGDGLYMHLGLLENTPQGTLSPQIQGEDPIDFLTGYYTLRTMSFEAQGEEMTFVPSSSPVATLGRTIFPISNLSALGDGDRSLLPPPYRFSLNAGLPVALGWTRQRQRATKDDVSRYIISAKGALGEVGVYPISSIDDVLVYDDALAIEGVEDLRVYWIEAGLNGNGAPSEKSYLKLASLRGLTEGERPFLSSPLVLSEDASLRRVSVVPGPHVTGVLTSHVGAQQEQRLMFRMVLEGGMPTCEGSVAR